MHYQCPFNAEVYVHRCGRTARIGRNGESCAVLSPDDNKAFKAICQVLKKSEEDLKMFDVKYTILDKIRPLIDQAKELEKSVHRTRQDEKSADWMI
jgi:ATP-dependent RNA helicase DDX24/MAK5